MYDTELCRVLINWIVKHSYEVTGYWHLVEKRVGEKDRHYYIVIKSSSQTIILELLVTTTKTDLNVHFSRALEYADKLLAEETWIAHFTCEDNATLAPHYPSNNVIHFFMTKSLKKYT